jgi:uncharacterized protein YkwD
MPGADLERKELTATDVIRRLALLAALVCLGPSPGLAQTSYRHNVERLTAAEVGPYRPEERPRLAEVEQQIVALTNQFRRENDLEPVSKNSTLKETASDFAAYMARTDKYGHTADGNQPHQRAKQHDYEYCIVSENIAYQFRTRGFETAQLAQRFFEGWKNSPPHRENMLDPHVTETGVAVAQSETTGVFYAVQMFGRPRSASIEFSIANPTDQAIRYRIAEQTFELPPRYTRTHTRCRPGEVQLLAESEREQTAAQAVETIEPRDGEQFRIAVESGQPRFEKTGGNLRDGANGDG